MQGAIKDELRQSGFFNTRYCKTEPMRFGDHSEIFDDKTEPECLHRAENSEADEVTLKLIGLLPGVKQRTVMQLYYLKGMTLRQIGKKLHLTESRISQLHVEGVRTLTMKLQGRAADFSSWGVNVDE